MDGYPILKLDDLYTKLAGGQMFTELDLSYTYELILVEENSSEFLTINTHKSLFRYKRLPYGVSSAPVVLLHNILITQLLGHLSDAGL